MNILVSDIWALANKSDGVCILTNGYVKKDGTLTMGAGIAKQCAEKFPSIPKLLGSYVSQHGNRVFNLGVSDNIRLISFPTKDDFRSRSSLELIEKSAVQLNELINKEGWTNILLPMPGVGCGKLDWKEVEPILDKYLDERVTIVTNNQKFIPKKTLSKENITPVISNPQPRKVLECSSKGDKRFSAMYVTLQINNTVKSIEEWYQGAKGFNSPVKSAKGVKPDFVNLFGKKLPISYLTNWYYYLWLIYLDNNPSLVEYARGFDDFSDMFKGRNTKNCQADVIKMYVKEGREAILKVVGDLLQQLNSEEHTKEYNFGTNSFCNSVCVTGHRPKNLFGYTNTENTLNQYRKLQNFMYKCVKQFMSFGCTDFYNGNAQGIDQLWSEVVNYISHNDNTNVKNIVYCPYRSQSSIWKGNSLFSKQYDDNILQRATKVEYLYNDPTNNADAINALLMRNKEMVNKCKYIIGFYNGNIEDITSDNTNASGGTLHCLRYAYQQGRCIVVINPFTYNATRINF